jgi:hypothetical protein
MNRPGAGRIYRKAVQDSAQGVGLGMSTIEARSADKIIAQGGGFAEPWVPGTKSV